LLVAFTSDLHVDYQLEVVGLVARRVEELRPDALVVAGDLSPDLRMCERALKLLAGSVDELLFVPGNHDLWPLGQGSRPYYRGVANSRQRYEEVFPEMLERLGGAYLGLRPHYVGDVAFCGVTGWYDFSLRNRRLDDVLRAENYVTGRYQTLQWMDCRHIDWPGSGSKDLRDIALCKWMVARLEEQLAEAQGLAKRIVAVTHFLTHCGMVRHTGEPRNDFLNGFQGSELLGELIDSHPGVVRVISGHYHHPVEREAKNSGGRCIRQVSPIGYPRDRTGPLADHVRMRVKSFEL
jgi:hypothetical protein